MNAMVRKVSFLSKSPLLKLTGDYFIVNMLSLFTILLALGVVTVYNWFGLDYSTLAEKISVVWFLYPSYLTWAAFIHWTVHLSRNSRTDNVTRNLKRWNVVYFILTVVGSLWVIHSIS